jgi:hypothetical protein
MAQKTVIVTIDENGDSTIDLNGFAGKGCDRVLGEFAGRDSMKIERTKPEYHTESKDAQTAQRNRS